MAKPIDIFSEDRRKLSDILGKIVAYQKSLPDGRAVELDELQRAGVLSPSDTEFMSSNSVTYKPHRVSNYHAADMLHMPMSGGGCVFIGPAGHPLSKRRARLGDLQLIVRNFLKLPRQRDELLLHIEFTKHDGMGVASQFISFTIRSNVWRQRLPLLRTVAAEFGFSPFQDNEVQGRHALTFRVSADADHTAATVATLLGRGCGFPDDEEIVYSAGALDEA
ncbi:MAG TPA: hypothetical protein VL981_06000 [Candidatus Methylacidiphilales bacterium]|nr:hypothetical protein [Candidatus Methylacidiphilales bacterium]